MIDKKNNISISINNTEKQIEKFYSYSIHDCIDSFLIQALIDNEDLSDVTKNRIIDHIMKCNKCQIELAKTYVLFQKLNCCYSEFKNLELIDILKARQVAYKAFAKQVDVSKAKTVWLPNSFINLFSKLEFIFSKIRKELIPNSHSSSFENNKAKSLRKKLFTFVTIISCLTFLFLILIKKYHENVNLQVKNFHLSPNSSVSRPIASQFTYTLSAPPNYYLLEVINSNIIRKMPLQGDLMPNTAYKIPSIAKLFVTYEKENFLAVSNNAEFITTRNKFFILKGDIYCRISCSGLLLQIETNHVKIAPKVSEFYVEARPNVTRVSLEKGSIILQSNKDKIIFKKRGTLFILHDGTITTNFEPSDVYFKIPLSKNSNFSLSNKANL